MIRLWLLLLICVPGLDVENIEPAGPIAFAELKALAKELDLWDRDDGWGAFANEVRWLRHHYCETWDAPPSCDLHRFPKAVAQDYINFNRKLRDWTEAKHGTCYHCPAALGELDYRYRVWYAVYEACDCQSCPATKRQALRELKRLVGDEAYYTGNLPAHVPWELYK